MNAFKKIDRWHKTAGGYFVFGAGELMLSYGFVSWAIDSGRLSAWAFGIVLFFGAMGNFVKSVWKLMHGHKAASAR